MKRYGIITIVTQIYTTRVAGAAASEQLLAFLHQHTVVPVTPEIATLAATLGARHQLAIADALIYATTQAHHATLLTQNENFKDLPQVRYFPKTKGPVASVCDRRWFSIPRRRFTPHHRKHPARQPQ